MAATLLTLPSTGRSQDFNRESFLQAVKDIVRYGELEDNEAVASVLGVPIDPEPAPGPRVATTVDNPSKSLNKVQYSRVPIEPEFGRAFARVILSIYPNVTHLCIPPEQLLEAFGRENARKPPFVYPPSFVSPEAQREALARRKSKYNVLVFSYPAVNQLTVTANFSYGACLYEITVSQNTQRN